MREEEYRRRLADVKSEVQRRLEYQLQLESLHGKYEQRHLISWLEDAVRQTLQSKPVNLSYFVLIILSNLSSLFLLQDESIPQCISTLKNMSVTS